MRLNFNICMRNFENVEKIRQRLTRAIETNMILVFVLLAKFHKILVHTTKRDRDNCLVTNKHVIKIKFLALCQGGFNTKVNSFLF